MPHRLPLSTVRTAFFIAVGALVTATPAYAGFQWVAPTDSVSAPDMGSQQMPVTIPSNQISQPALAPMPVPEAQASPEIISPLVIVGDNNPQLQAQPLPLPQAPAQAPMRVMNSAPPPVDNSTVSGFANSVPLPVALRQILPVGYAYSIDQDVDMGTLISFKGGRGWRDTLREALDPVGLSVREQGQMVQIGHAGALALAPVPVVAPVPTAVVGMTPHAPRSDYQSGMEPKNLGVLPNQVIAVSPQPAVIAPVPDDSIRIEPSHMPDTTTTENWTAQRGDHLRTILEGWCRRSNIEFNWLSEYDYPLEASVSFNGNFEMAVRSLLGGFEDARPQPVAELHSNPGVGQMVLVVRARGNTDSD